jgi:hypothetical protein
MNFDVKMFALITCMAAPLAFGQSNVDQPSQSQAPTPSSQMNQPMQRVDLKQFTGKIYPDSTGQLILLDPPTRITYFLDNQQLARKFRGKEVTVKGYLIPPGKTIHVKEIDGAR